MKNSYIIPAAVLGGALIIAAAIGAYSFYSVRSLDNTIVVTGSAKQSVTADSAKWTINVSRVVNQTDVSYAYSEVAADTKLVKDFLAKNGVTPDEITVSPIYVDDYWSGKSDGPRQSNVRQSVTVKTSDVERVKTMSENTLALAQEGVQFSPQPPEYYVSTLPAIRIALLGKAVADARARAVELVKPMGQGVGKLKSASSGVTQVLQPDSIDVSDYGQYDTSTIEKDVMITVHATFVLD